MGEFRIYNYFCPSNPEQTFQNVSDWKKEIEDLTRDYMIVNWSHYTTPLVTIKDYLGETASEAARWMSPHWMLGNLGRNHGLFHKFLTFELKETSDMNTEASEPCFVSFEKQKWGLLFQISRKEETVRDFALQNQREGIKLHDSSKDRGFEGRLVDNLAYMDQILEAIETNALYNLFSNNCQTTVEDFQKTVATKSLELNYHIPGSEDSIPLTDPRVLSIVEDLHPQWKAGVVQQFPELPNPFSIEVIATVDMKDDAFLKSKYGILLQKQRVMEAVTEMLKKNPDDDHCSGRKAVISNMSKGKFENALSLTNQLPRSIIHDLSELWSYALELTVVLEPVGIIVFAFQEADHQTDNTQELLEMCKLLSKIGKNQEKAQPRIHIVNILLETSKDFQSKTTKHAFGYRVDVSLCNGTLRQPAVLQLRIKSAIRGIMGCFSATKEQVPISEWKSSLNNFAARLFLLQNLEPEAVLIHQRIIGQQYGRRGFCIWTNDQRNIINRAQQAFQLMNSKQFDIATPLAPSIQSSPEMPSMKTDMPRPRMLHLVEASGQGMSTTEHPSEDAIKIELKAPGLSGALSLIYRSPDEMAQRTERISPHSLKREEKQFRFPLRLAICGDYGAGKTMIMMQLAQDFLKCVKNGVIFICLHKTRKNLIRKLHEQIKQYDFDTESLILSEVDIEAGNVGDIKIPGLHGFHKIVHGSESKIENDASVRLVLVDDFPSFDETGLPHIKSMIENPNESSMHNVVFTVEANSRFRERSCLNNFLFLKDGNLRSSLDIAQFISEYDSHLSKYKFLQGMSCNNYIYPTSSFQPCPGIQLRTTATKVMLFKSARMFKKISDSCSEQVSTDIFADEQDTQFWSFCNKKLQEIANEGEMETMVYHITKITGNGHVIHHQHDNWLIVNHNERLISGCQFPRVIIILSSFDEKLAKDLIDIMSRATSSLRFIIAVPTNLEKYVVSKNLYRRPQELFSFFVNKANIVESSEAEYKEKS